MVCGLPRSALDLLDALVCMSNHGQWVRRSSVELHAVADERTCRRNTGRLLDWSLVEIRREGRGIHLRATALGRALIDGHHRSQRPLEGLCAK